MFKLDQVVPWGRSFEEYRRMFALSDADLGGRILDGDVVKAVDQVRAAGVENIGLLTEKIPNKSASGRTSSVN